MEQNSPLQKDLITPKLQLVAWEITRSCNLFCAHCRASAVHGPYPDELSTEECFSLVDEIQKIGNPIIILTGGEPLKRGDVLQVARYAVNKGLRVVMGTNGTLLDDQTAVKLKDAGLSRISISLDFPGAKLQDEFRGQAGAYDAAIKGIGSARRAGIEVQINSTLTRMNVMYLDQLLALALELGAVAFHPFLLVPTGRGKGLENVALSAGEHEKTLNWIYDKQQELGEKIFFKPTDAPHYMRIVRQRQKGNPAPVTKPQGGHGHPANAMTRGCFAGTGFCFISHVGRVQGCGYLDVEAGNVKNQSFSRIWAESPVFNRLRDLSNIKGKCGACEYKRICGGCRARAFESTGDYLEAEPYCIYQPSQRKETAGA